METSAEDNPSSASSSNGSQPPSLAASQIQQQQSATVSTSLHTSAMMSTKKPDISIHSNSIIDKENATNAGHLSAFVSFRKSSSSSQGSGAESKYDLGSEFQMDNDDLFSSTSIHDSKLGNQASRNNDNGLANDMSSLMINDQSLHKSMLEKDTSVSAASIVHQNQSLLNHSCVKASEYPSQGDLENHYKSIHESRVEEQLQDFSIHQDTTSTAAVAAQQEKNESVLNELSVSRPTTEQLCIDPWNDELKQNLLVNLQPPLCAYPGYTVIENNLPEVGPDMAVGLGESLASIFEVEPCRKAFILSQHRAKWRMNWA